MFTGIIEEIGIVRTISKNSDGALICIESKKTLEGLKLGDSISINGACQSVTKFDGKSFSFQSAIETLKLTNLSALKPNDKVNLERAMPANGRLDGHIVSGHIDETATFVKREKEGFSQILSFNAGKETSKYLVKKGSICVNGVSLTITNVTNDIFSISVIPITIKDTNLALLKLGDKVNIEADIIAKYVEKFVQRDENKGKVTLEFLKENGF